MHSRIVGLSFLILCFSQFPAFAANSTARCYRFSSTNLPYNEAHVVPRTELWCYQGIEGNEGSIYIYNADYEKVRPELAIVKRSSGVLTHGSLVQGHLTIHNLKAGTFNPFPVPLQEPQRLAAEAPPRTPDFENSVRSVLAMLLLAQSATPNDLTVTEGIDAAVAAYEPWRGYWWPNKGQPMVGPLRKYDAFVKALTGESPKAAAWERSHHVSHNIWWEGHCNGWAAASILRYEPQAPQHDNRSDVTFSVSDQKGILTEADYCANSTMFGRRYNGRGDDLYDIRPELFHNTILYYIGYLKKPVAMDYRRDGVVDNHVISGYQMSIERTESGELEVTTTLRMHQYEGIRSEKIGVAKPYSRVYRYRLKVDENNRAVGGSWISENPDFIWAPLSPGRCREGTAPLKEEMIRAIIH